MFSIIKSLFLPNKIDLVQPIFLVGCSKSGTTMLSLIIGYHHQVGPRLPHTEKFSSLQSFLNSMLDAKTFGPIASAIEKKKIWDKYLPANHVPLRTGKELILLKNPLSKRETIRLIYDLSKDLKEPRFFAKGPFNTFRIHVLREIFPDAKIINIYRDGRDVISSWARMRGWSEFGGIASSINTFARKWNESINHVEKYKKDLDIYTIKYEDIINSPQKHLSILFNYCQLENTFNDFNNLELRNSPGIWKKRIPAKHHSQITKLTIKNLQVLGYEK